MLFPAAWLSCHGLQGIEQVVYACASNDCAAGHQLGVVYATEPGTDSH